MSKFIIIGSILLIFCSITVCIGAVLTAPILVGLAVAGLISGGAFLIIGIEEEKNG